MYNDLELRRFKGVELTWATLRLIASEHEWRDILTKLTCLNEEDYILFKSDGCTLWPDYWGSFTACFAHDIRYYLGGDVADKMRADANLWIDVYYAQSEYLADIMFAGVRAAGHLPGTGFRFGYGLRL